MKFTKNRKLLAVLAILSPCSFGIMGCRGQQADVQQSVEDICKAMFTDPSENNSKFIDPEFQEIGTNRITNEGEEASEQCRRNPHSIVCWKRCTENTLEYIMRKPYGYRILQKAKVEVNAVIQATQNDEPCIIHNRE